MHGPESLIGQQARQYVAMDVAKPYKFIGFGPMDVTKPYEFTGFGAMYVAKPYEFIGIRAVQGRGGRLRPVDAAGPTRGLL